MKDRSIVTISAVMMSLAVFVAAPGPAWTASSDKTHKKQVAAAPKCDRGQFHLVVDVGHSEESHGAMSARNVPEYEFNLRLATEIEQSLIQDGFAKTALLVTHGPKIASLHQRVGAANHMQADFFLSIHHDSVPDWFLENWDYEGTPSHFSDRFSGHSLFVSYENPDFKDSMLFARLLGKQLKDRNFKYASHYTEAFMGWHRRELIDAETGVYRYDQLQVLRSTQMPAVLLEAGSIINRDEEVVLNTPAHRALITAAVTAAVESYCDAQVARPDTAQPATDPTPAKASAPGGWPAFLGKLFERN